MKSLQRSQPHPPNATRPARWLRAVLAVGVVCAFMFAGGLLVNLSGCSAERHSQPHAPSVDGEHNAALVSMSIGFHKRADIALSESRRDDAKAEMVRLLELCYQYDVRTPDSYDVLFDAATRLARMHSEDGELDKAEDVARKALSKEVSAPQSLFRGYLHQSLADILEKKGDLRGAVDEHGAAIAIFKAILDTRPPLPSAPSGGAP